MKKTDAKQILKNKYCVVMLSCILIGIIVTLAVFFKDSGRVSAVSSILFTFEGAAEGHTPDGEEFDIRMLAEDAILEAALEACNMKEKYTPEQLRSSLYIRGDYPENIAGEILSFESLFDYEASKTFTHDGFHATSYTVALYNDFDKSISKKQLEQLLSAVMTTYGNTFKTQYGKTWNSDLLGLDLDDYDYIQQLTILKDQLEQAAGFAEELYQKEPGVITGGESFNDICIRMRNLADNEIPRLQAMVVMGGLSRDAERLLIQYEYEIEDLCIRLKHQSNRLKEVEQLLASYEKNDILYISSGEELTRIDGNSSQTYDALVAEKREVADRITDIRSDISERLLSMKDILDDDEVYSEYFDKVYAVLVEQVGAEESQQLISDTGLDDPEADTDNGGDNPEENSEENSDREDSDAEDNPDAEALPDENTTASILHKGRENNAEQLAALEAEIKALEEKITAVESDFNNMLAACNEQQLNDGTVSISETQLVSRKLISGAFIKTGIKCAGPFVSIGIMVCVIMVLLDSKKKEKKTHE